MFRLGAGGMGRVYLARSSGGRYVALKTVHPWLAGTPGFRERFGLEIEASRRVSGSGTVAVVAADAGAASPWLASEYVPGPSLAEAVRDHGPLPDAVVWRLLSGLVEALGQVHGCRLVHRDLKPSNVLLSQDGPRLIDFGVVRAVDRTALTGTGLAVGSPGYMAPEQARGEEVGPAADVFALGAVLAYAATGREAFGGGSGPDVLYRVVHQEPEIDGLPDDLAAIVRSCLAKQPDERPSLAALRALAAAHDTGGDDWLPGPVMSEIAARAVHLLSLDAPSPPPSAPPTPTAAAGGAAPATELNARRLAAAAPATGHGSVSADQRIGTADVVAADTRVLSSDGSHGRKGRHRLRTALAAVLGVIVVVGIAVGVKALQDDETPSSPTAAGSTPSLTKPASGAAPSPTTSAGSPPSPTKSASGATASPTASVNTSPPAETGTPMERMAKTLERLLPPGTGRVEIDPGGNDYADTHAFVVISGERRFDVMLRLNVNRESPAPNAFSCDYTATLSSSFRPNCTSGVLPTGEKAMVVRTSGVSGDIPVPDIPSVHLWHGDRDIELMIWPDARTRNVVPVPLTDRQLLAMVGDNTFLSLTQKIRNRTAEDG